jgi:hypothetical protein
MAVRGVALVVEALCLVALVSPGDEVDWSAGAERVSRRVRAWLRRDTGADRGVLTLRRVAASRVVV